MKHQLLAACAVLLSTTVLSGCVGVTVTAQERPIETAFNDFGARTDLNARMLAEDPLLFTNVSTTVIEGRIHLAGSVNSEEQRQRAQQLAWATPGVREVINSIEITSQAGLIETVDDRWISGQVRANILADGNIRDSNYTIDTQNRVVYVMGIAQNADELDRVLKHAAIVKGVRQVVNYAVMKDDPRRQTSSAPAPVMRPEASAPAPARAASQPPVLSDDRGQGFSANTNALPKPVEVAPLPLDPARATGAPRPLFR
jgi:osmotically-inducible protein OsmY